MPAFTVKPCPSDPRPHAERILRSVPEWFGIEEYTRKYIEDTARLPTQFAHNGSEPVGFLTLLPHFPRSAEVYCMAVRRDFHRAGVGRALIDHTLEECRANGVEFLQVKTQGPSRPCPQYDLTRAFYQAVGFTPLEEFSNLWPGNPCLLMVRRT